MCLSFYYGFFFCYIILLKDINSQWVATEILTGSLGFFSLPYFFKPGPESSRSQVDLSGQVEF